MLDIKNVYSRLSENQTLLNKVTDIYIILIALFPLTTMVQEYIDSINRIVFAGLLVVQAALFVLKCKNKWSYVLMGVTALLEVVALVNTGFRPMRWNDVMYFPFMILFFEYFVLEKESIAEGLRRNMLVIKGVVILWTAIVVISAFLPSSYSGGWQMGTYFLSITGDSFRLGPAALFALILILVVVLMDKKKWYAALSVVPAYCFFFSGARIYFALGVAVIGLIWYVLFDKKKYFWLSLIPIGIIGTVIFLRSSIFDKFISQTFHNAEGLDFWASFTSGRTIFWEIDLRMFFQQDFLGQLLGKGFNFIYDVNTEFYTGPIWAHNDFIQIVATYGYVGLGIYILAIIRLFKSMFCVKRAYKVIPLVITVFVWLFNAFMNMFYTYSCALISFPLLVVALEFWKADLAKSDLVEKE